MNESLENFNMVIFGATGDLSFRKIFPALYYRLKENQITSESNIIAIVRKKESYISLKKDLENYLKNNIVNIESKSLTNLMKMVKVVLFDINTKETYNNLKKSLNNNENKIRVYYLATPANVFGPISNILGNLKLINSFSRIVLEKPLGKDKTSSKKINEEVLKNFKENQIYRIDHYLGKETVQNLMVLRFANYLFENSWNANHIKSIQITAAEKIGVEKRGDYYNNYGALLDMVQNHLLQLLCLIAMEPPTSLSAEEVRIEKHKVLKSLRLFDKKNIQNAVIKGQYSRGNHNGSLIPSYLEDIEQFSSNTETFIALRAYVDNWRWKGVPFYLRTGKRMSEKFTEIIITFKNVPHNVFLSANPIVANKLIIRLQPKEKIEFIQMIKIPGPGGYRYKPVSMKLDYQESINVRFPQAYERLLMDIIRGNQTLFMSNNELSASWDWIESITSSLKKTKHKMTLYNAGTNGPGEQVLLNNDSWNF